MLESWMDVYVTIFVLAGLGVAFLSQLKVLRGHKKIPKRKYRVITYSQEDELPQDKRNAFSWMAFFSLSLVGLLIPFFAFISNTMPNNLLPELIFCFFYILGPFLILQWLVVNRETGRLAVSLPSFWWVYLIACWVSPWRLLKTGFDARVLLVTLPLISAHFAGVSWVLILSVIPSMIIFSWVMDVARVHD